jgi:hypothetical protein
LSLSFWLSVENFDTANRDHRSTMLDSLDPETFSTLGALEGNPVRLICLPLGTIGPLAAPMLANPNLDLGISPPVADSRHQHDFVNLLSFCPGELDRVFPAPFAVGASVVFEPHVRLRSRRGHLKPFLDPFEDADGLSPRNIPLTLPGTSDREDVFFG